MPERTPSASSSQPERAAGHPRAWHRRPWIWAVLAFAAGLLLFAMVLMRGRQDDFFRAGEGAPAASAPDYAPLPTPLPSSGADTVGLPPAQDAERGDAAGPRLVETGPAPPPPAVPAQRERARTTAHVDPRPIPGRTPPPRYPLRALRRGQEGLVNVRAQIGPDGVPTSVSLVSGSGSRDLDRAALEAVRRWRFAPAQADGRPTVGTVVIPIEFNRE